MWAAKTPSPLSERQNIMLYRAVFVSAAIAAGTFASQAAWAADLWPGSVLGTWNLVANQSALTVVVSSQASTGKCRQITGTVTDNTSGEVDSLLGYYCPTSGRLHFTRTTPSGQTFQDYSGNTSDKGKTTYLGGTFSEVASPLNVGEYAFFGFN
jgi:hypothetical protein